jgi:hypothetical protein
VSRWTTALAFPWQLPPPPINVGETIGAALAVRRAARVPALHGARVLFLIDNLACLGALAKGRSSATVLNAACSAAAAALLAAGIVPVYAWVASASQPADLASRPPLPAAGQGS